MELNMCKLTTTPIEADETAQTELQNSTLKTELINEELKDASLGGKIIRSDRPLERKHDERIKSEHTEKSTTELLGSVTTHNCHGTRTSARVIQKMKQDQTRPLTPPPNEHGKKDEKITQKTPSQVRQHRSIWTNLERNYFFDALNEFGKDFEQLSNCINAKLKRRGTSDFPFKTKEQVRLHYYQTYHKICKYIRYSDEIKKPAQELYTLINYGEMRRKLQFLSEKHFIKLRQLIYQGHATIRSKGKNIRIKTPSCKALRRLNQLDDTLEDIRLPTKIEVIVSPANMEAFGRVQALAQNPRARATVPLHKKLSNFIKTFQYKWRSNNARLAEEEMKLFPALPNEITPTDTFAACSQDGEICFRPKPGVPIHRPLLSITEYLSSVNICLTAYEERMGVKVRSETISYDRNLGTLGNSKRQRTESGSEKRSPDLKKIKAMHSPLHDKSFDEAMLKEDLAASEGDAVVGMMQTKVDSSSGDELSDELHELLGDLNCESSSTETNKNECNTVDPNALINSNAGTLQTQARNKRTTITAGPIGGSTSANIKSAGRNSLNFKPLLSDDSIKSIRKGWTFTQAADITVGDLYVVLGQDSKLELEYYWRDDFPATKSSITTTASLVTTTSEAQLAASQMLLTAPTEQVDLASITGVNFLHKELQLAENAIESETVTRLKSVKTSLVSNKLKHLLLIANLSDRVRKRQCLCGHTCDRNAAKTRIERDLAKGYITSTITTNSSEPISTANEGLFRQPLVPVRRPILSIDPVRQPLTRQKMSRHVLVQRRLLPPGRTTHSHPMGMYNVKNMYIESTKTNDEQNSRNELLDNQNDAKSSTESNAHEAGNNYETSLNDDYINAPISWDSKSSVSSTQTTSEDGSAIPASTSTSSASSSTTNNSSGSNSNKNEFLTNWNNNNTPSSRDSSSSSSVTATATPTNIRTKNGNKIVGCLDFVEEALLTSTLPESAYDESTTSSFFNGMMSPMHLLRESTSNSRWLEENLNDFSLTSLLGHLDEINATRDILDPSSNMSVISESSVDYRHKFQEISALMQSQEKD